MDLTYRACLPAVRASVGDRRRLIVLEKLTRRAGLPGLRSEERERYLLWWNRVASKSHMGFLGAIPLSLFVNSLLLLQTVVACRRC